MRVDPRLLIALVSLFGSLAWLLPWPALFVFLPPALCIAAAAYVLMPGGQAALKACLFFVLFWALSYFLLQIWEAAPPAAAFCQALIFGARLLCIFGLALVLPLCLGAVAVGRVLTWYLERPALLLRGRLREGLMEAAWKAGLALTVMAAFMPRAFCALRGLAQTLKLRAPHLPLRQRILLLGAAILRLLGTQTWDMAVSIAARDLYRAEPWKWRR